MIIVGEHRMRDFSQAMTLPETRPKIDAGIHLLEGDSDLKSTSLGHCAHCFNYGHDGESDPNSTS